MYKIDNKYQKGKIKKLKVRLSNINYLKKKTQNLKVIKKRKMKFAFKKGLFFWQDNSRFKK